MSAINAAPLLAGQPGITLGSTWPGSVHCLRYRLIVAREMANLSATSAYPAPASMARSTRCRKSCEEAFIPSVYHESFCTSLLGEKNVEFESPNFRK